MHGRQIRLRDHLNSTSHNSAHAVEHNDGVTGADPAMGIQGIYPPSPVVILSSDLSFLSFLVAIISHVPRPSHDVSRETEGLVDFSV